MADTASNLFKIILGIFLIALPIYALIFNFYGLWNATWILIKGGITLFIILIGLIFLILGFSELK